MDFFNKITDIWYTTNILAHKLKIWQDRVQIVHFKMSLSYAFNNFNIT